MKGFFEYVKRNPSLGAGMAMLAFLLLFTSAGRLIVNPNHAYPLSVMPTQPPSAQYPFGTDTQGRDLLAVMVVGTGMTLEIGAIAGGIGLGVGIVLGFVSGYVGGILDTVLTSIIDVYMSIPGFLILVLVASIFSRVNLGVTEMGLIVAIVSWPGSARAIRAQVLSMRERPFVMMAKLSGMGAFEIIMKELVPNLAPYLVMSLANSVYGGLQASLGLEALGIGSRREPTLGMTLYYVQYYSALMLGMWWWIIEPIIVIVLVLTSLFMTSFGLDEIANPRRRKTV